jgi:hypothetical protein
VRFSERPFGAPVWLDGTRNDRALAPTSIFVGEQGVHPAAVPFRLPEAEVEGVRKENVFAAPRTQAPGLHVWLVPRAGRQAPVAIGRENCEQLKALGYVADCPAQ